MRTEMVTVYTINELSKEVQERVIDRYRNMDGFCWDECNNDVLSEGFQYQLADTMFEDCKVEWSLSSCQGDGVMLIGEVDHDILYKVVEESGDFDNHELRRIKFLLDYTRFELVRNHYRNSFFNTVSYTDCIPMGYSYSKKLEANLEALLESLDNIIKREADKLTDEMERIGYDIIDSNYTDEHIIELLEDGEYEFYEDGRDF